LRARVTKRDERNHIVNVHFIIEERPPRYVERIEITGNKQTKDQVIRRELKFAEGDIVNPYIWSGVGSVFKP
jgi:outer membrane protein insertion porin family